MEYSKGQPSCCSLLIIGEMDSRAFYEQCLMEFHAIAANRGLAGRGVVYAPDLMPFGEKAVAKYYGDVFLATEFSTDPTQYYYTVNCFCLQCGILFAGLYRTDPLALTEGYIDSVTSVDPWQFAERVAKESLGLDLEALNLLCTAVFNRWIDLVEPFYAKPEGSDAIYYATLAMYRLGISLAADGTGCQSHDTARTEKEG